MADHEDSFFLLINFINVMRRLGVKMEIDDFSFAEWSDRLDKLRHYTPSMRRKP